MAWLREPPASRLRYMAQRLPDLRPLLSQRFAALDRLGSVRKATTGPAPMRPGSFFFPTNWLPSVLSC